jgi:branched-chain amino acid transport system substrate-binding protein
MTNKLAAWTLAALLGTAGAATAQNNKPVQLGVLTDMSGVMSYILGPGSVEAARLAVADFGGKVLGRPIEVLQGDTMNKADAGSLLARRWYDAGVDVILDVPNSSVALAVAAVAKERGKLAFISGAATDRLTEEDCNPRVVQWGLDSYSEASAVVPLMDRGKKTFYLAVADYAFGHTQEVAARALIAKNGGKVVGSVYFPPDTNDYSSFLLQAQAAKPDVVELLVSGGETLVNAFKQAKEFGLMQGSQQVATLHVYVNDVHALGLDGLQGLEFLVSSYWDLDAESRAFAKRFYDRMHFMPAETQAAVYSAALQYLNAVKAVGSTDPDKVMNWVRSNPINDMYSRNGRVLANGRLIHDMYHVRIKAPKDSKYPWDYFEVLDTVPGEAAFRPIAESKCPMVH